jgi:hypothetical protein
MMDTDIGNVDIFQFKTGQDKHVSSCNLSDCLETSNPDVYKGNIIISKVK